MAVSVERLQKVLDDWPARAAEALRPDPAENSRAWRLAEALAGLLGKGVTVGCRLQGELALLGSDGRRWTEAVEDLERRLRRANQNNNRVKLRLPDKRLAWAFRLGSPAAVVGQLVLSGPPRSQPVLALFGVGAAQVLSSLLQQDSQPVRAAVIPTDSSYPPPRELVHDLSNSLSRMLFQTAIVQLRCPEELKADLQVIREEGKAAGDTLQTLRTVMHELFPDEQG